jgi:large subunit ribosomal protein L30
MAKKSKVRVRLVKSLIGVPGKHKSIVKALGLKKRGSSVVQEQNPAIDGMIFKIRHLVQIERVEE